MVCVPPGNDIRNILEITFEVLIKLVVAGTWFRGSECRHIVEYIVLPLELVAWSDNKCEALTDVGSVGAASPSLSESSSSSMASE